MTLPSQFARPTSRHNHMFRRRRGGRRAFLGLLAALSLAVFGLWKWLGSDAEPQAVLAEAEPAVEESIAPEEPASTQSLARDGGVRATLPPQQERSRPTAETPNQPEIRMGEPTPRSSSSQPRTETSSLNSSIPAAGTTASEPAAPAATKPGSASSESPSGKAPVSTESSSRAATPAQRRALERMRIGNELLASNRPLEGRIALTQALDSGELSGAEQKKVRATLTELNNRLVFSPEIVTGDPYSFGYTIRSGDALSRLPRSQNLATDWRLIQRVNRILRPQAIRPGQSIKLVSGPFHAVVYKQQFRMDIYLGEGAERVYVRSFSVGLGEYDSTPVGTFAVRPNSKLINPEWVNPRTGERFLPDDPKNPIGEHWIGLTGASEGVRDLGGYGIHGTIEPHSIGRQASMGCIRMHAEDIELVYELLVEDHSTIQIVDG